MTAFDLRALIREVIDTSPYPDPQMLAKEVSRRIKRTDQASALEQALPTVVQHVVSRSRHHIDPPGGHFQGDARGASPAGGTSSHKVRSIREWWRRCLRDRISVGPEPGDWKFLTDCTAADLGYAAAIREEHARRNTDRAKEFRALAVLLSERGVATVGELADSDPGSDAA